MLINSLRLSEGFKLFIVTCESWRYQREFMRRLWRATRYRRVDVLDIQRGVVDQVRDKVKDKGSSPIILLGLEHLLFAASEQIPLMQDLNMSRPVWLRDFARPIVIMATPDAERLLALYAPDLYRYRSGTIEVPMQPSPERDRIRELRYRIETVAASASTKLKWIYDLWTETREVKLDAKFASEIRPQVGALLESLDSNSSFLRELARRYIARGNHSYDGLDFIGAVVDFDAAIHIQRILRNRQLPLGQWHAECQSEHAGAYMNRGVANACAQNLDAAVSDYGDAISILTGLGDQLLPLKKWDPKSQNTLAAAYMNRGNAYRETQNLDAAMADYGNAIFIMTGLRDVQLPLGQWHPEYENDLAGAYMNRGNVHQNGPNLDAAVSDYGHAISLMTGLRDFFRPLGQWHPPYQNDLAIALMNRSVAQENVEKLDASIADFDEAILIMTGLRDLLVPLGQWHPEYQNNLAMAFTNRGLAHERRQNRDLALKDYGIAIGIRTVLRDLLKTLGQWHPQFQSDLATTFGNRGVAHEGGENRHAAVADYGEAISILTGLRDLLLPLGQWHPQFQNDLAKAYINRGNAHQGGQNLDSAVADYGDAISIWRKLRRDLVSRGWWIGEIKFNYSKALGIRARLFRATGDLANAQKDEDEAAENDRD